jgi:hypothetical protein
VTKIWQSWCPMTDQRLTPQEEQEIRARADERGGKAGCGCGDCDRTKLLAEIDRLRGERQWLLTAVEALKSAAASEWDEWHEGFGEGIAKVLDLLGQAAPGDLADQGSLPDTTKKAGTAGNGFLSPLDPPISDEQAMKAVCLDCGRDYAQFGMDILLQRTQWLEIHPAENGLLCAQCIVNRSAKLPGTLALHLFIEVVPHRAAPGATVPPSPQEDEQPWHAPTFPKLDEAPLSKSFSEAEVRELMLKAWGEAQAWEPMNMLLITGASDGPAYMVERARQNNKAAAKCVDRLLHESKPDPSPAEGKP